ncbi:MAG TPA: bifunctional phosphoribosyl-AMP cyclohydrolase/phosphoribosyl-ATP diphosphatase HisIE [Gemmatimonadales bacterium]|nr:bifunctional phosphoribosyl-AMP cyclohydrolase/phosphoribosyl-ATP diphosphatase HisIE [Gemmatimonadales bacterium]
MSDDAWLSAIKFDAEGLVPVVAQESGSGDVLMVAYANRDALSQTRSTGLAHYYSRSRRALWLKGETSGHVQQVRQIRVDCDGDTVLYRVSQTGVACHTGERTCFATMVTPDGGTAHTADEGGHVLSRLAERVAARAALRPNGSYTVRLLEGGPATAAQKFGEEAVEVVVAALAQDDARLAAEAADLLYHLVVLFQARGMPLSRVWDELDQRMVK